jgi:hypothetical protein
MRLVPGCPRLIPPLFGCPASKLMGPPCCTCICICCLHLRLCPCFRPLIGLTGPGSECAGRLAGWYPYRRTGGVSALVSALSSLFAARCKLHEHLVQSSKPVAYVILVLPQPWFSSTCTPPPRRRKNNTQPTWASPNPPQSQLDSVLEFWRLVIERA